MSGQTRTRRAPFAILHVIFVIISFKAGGVSSRTLTITNHCGHTVWPGILSSAGSPALETTGFALEPGQSRSLPAPHGWSGRLWGRTHCSTDASTGHFSCATANCGSGRLDCAGHGAKPPATLAEFTFDGHEGLDFYDVSLVDGYNLPMLVEPHSPHGGGGGANCLLTGCVMDLNAACPAELRVGDRGDGSSVACRSACEAFGTAEHCCHGDHGNPDACWPTAYSQFFKKSCPRAYSYAYDDATSTFTCAGGGTSYAITFCPSATSVKSVETDPQVREAVGGGRVASSSWRTMPSIIESTNLVLLGVAMAALAHVF